MPVWLAVLLAVFSTGATIVSAWALLFYKQGAESRERLIAELRGEVRAGFARNDAAMERQVAATAQLAERVGAQNGRVGKLEDWRQQTASTLEKIEQRQWDDTGAGWSGVERRRRHPDRDEGGRE